MKARTVQWIALAAALVLLAVALSLGPRRSASGARTAGSPLAIVPPGAAFVLAIDLVRLRKSAAGQALARAGQARLAPQLPGCKFEPLTDMTELAMIIPGDARLESARGLGLEPDAVALVASGRFVGAAVADCSAEWTRSRGGDPVRTTIGSFASVRDRKKAGELAARDGLFVLSDGAYLRALLAAAEGHPAPGSELERASDRLHAELRRSFGRGAPIVATLTLPEGWLEARLGDPEVRRSPFADLRSAALRAEVNERVELEVLLACANAEGCARIERFVLDARQDLAPLLASAAAKRHLAKLESRRAGDRLELRLTLDASDVTELFASEPRR